ncbi:hypothetical protein AB4Y63_00705 [Leifsonia sp. YAF41]|uniref:hypothetical protein n=1 Tax=Leifsonia sp. YAF41 TaxID=3233086 RepID=UPI003F96D075
MSEQSANQAPGPRTRRSRSAHFGLLAVGIVAVLVGLVLFFLPVSPPTIGWFAYQPLSETTFVPSGTFLTPLQQTASGIGSLGMLLLAFAAGWAFGRREVITTQS